MAHGGKREGAGRKSTADEGRTKELCRAAISAKYGSIEKGLEWLLESKRENLIKFVFEHGLGKPTEKVDLGGGLTIQLTRTVVKS